MENHNIKAKHDITIKVNAPCPDCGKGHLLPFLEPKYEETLGYGRDAKFTHYEIVYRCSKCNYKNIKEINA